jgi:hypothetical protein
MQKMAVVLATVALLAFAHPSSAAIDRVQKEDGMRFGVGILNLYYNILSAVVVFPKTVFLGLCDLPKAVATDMLQVGQKGEPSAYYMTERERQEKEKQKAQEELLKQKEKGEKMLQEGIRPSENLPMTKIKSR